MCPQLTSSTIPIACWGFLMFPNTPQTTKAFYLSEDERALAADRVAHVRHVKMTWTTLRSSVKRVVLNWRWYLFSALFMVSATAFEKTGVYSEFNLWLSSAGYSATQVYVSCLTQSETLLRLAGTIIRLSSQYACDDRCERN